MASLLVLVASQIDSILTIWVASMRQRHQTISFQGEVLDEAARLFPQQRVLPGQNRVESEGARRRPPAAPSAQGRAARPGLSRHQPAGAGADAAGGGRDH